MLIQIATAYVMVIFCVEAGNKVEDETEKPKTTEDKTQETVEDKAEVEKDLQANKALENDSKDELTKPVKDDESHTSLKDVDADVTKSAHDLSEGLRKFQFPYMSLA